MECRDQVEQSRIDPSGLASVFVLADTAPVVRFFVLAVSALSQDHVILNTRRVQNAALERLQTPHDVVVGNVFPQLLLKIAKCHVFRFGALERIAGANVVL